mmetsp:Transcript_3315/g.9396  ORF Transcript_3315/g.9396 Transcript_3315/m.9396 type:complete len:268 (-) Transcript_3315:309-1112(-)
MGQCGAGDNAADPGAERSGRYHGSQSAPQAKRGAARTGERYAAQEADAGHAPLRIAAGGPEVRLHCAADQRDGVQVAGDPDGALLAVRGGVQGPRRALAGEALPEQGRGGADTPRQPGLHRDGERRRRGEDPRGRPRAERVRLAHMRGAVRADSPAHGVPGGKRHGFDFPSALGHVDNSRFAVRIVQQLARPRQWERQSRTKYVPGGRLVGHAGGLLRLWIRHRRERAVPRRRGRHALRMEPGRRACRVHSASSFPHTSTVPPCAGG